MYLVGWVNKKEQSTTGISIPGGLSFLTHGKFSAPITGLNAFAENERPSQPNAVFQFYHIMIAIGSMLILLSLYGGWLWWRKKLFDKKWVLYIFIWSVLLPQIANQVGWFTAEMGRQPWVVYGLLRTSDAFSKNVVASQIMFSLILFMLVYSTLFVLFLYLLNKKIKHGPVEMKKPDMNDDQRVGAK
jgi:cytochrome bd ubiquinol oxidase subunit I